MRLPSLRTLLPWLVYTTAGAAFVFIVLDSCFPLKIKIDYSQTIESKNGQVIHAFLTADGKWRMFTELKEITPQMKKAIIFKEDKYFYYHFGVNPFAVVRALVNNIVYHKRTSGASTITMQVARLLEPKDRTYGNKILEMFNALQLETHYSKSEILQLYLNLVPYGSNVEGVKAASVLYLNKTPEQLSLAELTALSVIPNRPSTLKLGSNDAMIIQERNKWLKRFEVAHLFSEQTIQDALYEPFHVKRHDAPAMAQQFSLHMHGMFPDKPIIKTNLDIAMQLKAEQIITNYMSPLQTENINNAAVLIIDNSTHAVVAYVGSSNFTDIANFGQVDGVQSVRSPGSTLKPLLYGLAFDKGLVTPKSVICDVPVNFKGYSPQNYDQQYHGNVTIEYALENSLNIPAVKMLDKVTIPVMVNHLEQANFETIKKDGKKLGLSLILGGCGVRLEEMTNLYSSLANGGKYYSIHWLKTITTKTKDSCVQLLSAPATFMVTDILAQLTRPDLPNGYENSFHLPRIAWKTGTSYGRRDAWSIGYNKKYTVGVWVGNFSGVGIADLSGANTATPLLFNIFNAIDYNSPDGWYTPPPGIDFRYVCSVTGKLPNDFCTDQVIDYYIPGVSSNEMCDHMKKVFVSANEKMSYCTSCLPENGYKIKYYPNISAELASYYDSHNIPYEKIPEHNPACERMQRGAAPVISSLTDGLDYYIQQKESQQLMLACNVGSDVKEVYWYVNNKFLSKAKAGEKLFFTPDAGNIKISCTDDAGRNSDIYIKVHYL